MSELEEHHGLVAVHACAHDEEASIVIAFLEQNGITARMHTELPHSVLPVSGDCEIYVHEDDATAARTLISEQLSKTEEPAEE